MIEKRREGWVSEGPDMRGDFLQVAGLKAIEIFVSILRVWFQTVF